MRCCVRLLNNFYHFVITFAAGAYSKSQRRALHVIFRCIKSMIFECLNFYRPVVLLVHTFKIHVLVTSHI